MLMRTDPFRELDRLTQQVLGTTARPAAMPMDAYRQGDSFYICLDLPGINPGSIDLTVEQNVLAIRAERAPVQADGAQMIVAERRGNADRLEIIEMVREGHQGDTQSQHTPGGSVAINPHLAAGDLWVADGGETSSQVDATGVGQQRHRILAG